VLSSVNIPAVKTLGSYAFSSCSSLKSIALPSVTSIGEGAFLNCWILDEVLWGATNAPAEQSSTFAGGWPGGSNYVTNPTATGWGTTFGGKPVVRLPYALQAPLTVQGTNVMDRFAGLAVSSVVATQVWSVAQYPLALTNAAAFDAAGTAAALSNVLGSAAFTAATNYAELATNNTFAEGTTNIFDVIQTSTNGAPTGTVRLWDGSMQVGYGISSTSIGYGSVGALQLGVMEPTAVLYQPGTGAGNLQQVYGRGTSGIVMTGNVFSCSQEIYATQASRAYMSGSSVLIGSTQAGRLQNNATMTNLDSTGCIQLGYLNNQHSIVSNSVGSIGLGAVTITNTANAIVAGHGQTSHGDGSVTAGGGFWTTNSHASNDWVVNYQTMTNHTTSISTNYAYRSVVATQVWSVAQYPLAVTGTPWVASVQSNADAIAVLETGKVSVVDWVSSNQVYQGHYDLLSTQKVDVVVWETSNLVYQGHYDLLSTQKLDVVVAATQVWSAAQYPLALTNAEDFIHTNDTRNVVLTGNLSASNLTVGGTITTAAITNTGDLTVGGSVSIYGPAADPGGNITLSGWGAAGVDGAYTPDTPIDGKPRWTKGAVWVYWSTSVSGWIIYNDVEPGYSAAGENVEYPWLATSWTPDPGQSPPVGTIEPAYAVTNIFEVAGGVARYSRQALLPTELANRQAVTDLIAVAGTSYATTSTVAALDVRVTGVETGKLDKTDAAYSNTVALAAGAVQTNHTGNVSITGNITASGAITGATAKVSGTATANAFGTTGLTPASGQAYAASIRTTGRAGIGADLNSQAQMYLTSAYLYAIILNHPSLPLLAFHTNGTLVSSIGGTAGGMIFYRGTGNTTSMVLGGDGNFGIGPDTTPDYNMDVQGSLGVDGLATLSSNLTVSGSITAGNGINATNTWVDLNSVTNTQIIIGGIMTSWTQAGPP